MKANVASGTGAVWIRAAIARCLAARVGALVAAGVAGSGCSAGGSAPDGATRVAGPSGLPEPAGEPTPARPGTPSVGPSGEGPGDLLAPGDVPVSSPAPGLPAARHRGLIERQVACADGATTRVSGTVYIPSGQLPLYNVMVYVPETELLPLSQGVSCSCEISGTPIVSALTDSNGHFVLENVPVGDGIPLVIQVGDWRREIDIGTVEPCVETAVPDGSLRLPANQAQGDIPRIAVATGRLDALECLVRKLGVDESEFTNPRGGGRVQLFSGSYGTARYSDELNEGGMFPPAEALWSDVPSLSQYDIVLLSCEGERDYTGNKSDTALEAMHDYANLGGRVFASHYHSVWFQRGPGLFPEIATFTSENDREYSSITGQVVTDFPKGEALAQWIESSGVAVGGEVPIEGGAHTIVQENELYAQRWLETIEPPSVQYISANTPLGASDAEQCGRVVLSDLHVSPGPRTVDGVRVEADFSAPEVYFPEGCVTDTLSPQEAVLAFMLFDLSACIVPDDQAPAPPPIIR
jgi:hypothetical protein